MPCLGEPGRPFRPFRPFRREMPKPTAGLCADGVVVFYGRIAIVQVRVG